MKRFLLFLFTVLLLASCEPFRKPAPNVRTGRDLSAPAINISNKGDISFGSFFLDKTMRLDLYHSGNSKEEHFAVDQVVSDGPWPGSKKILIDKLGLGLYFFEVIDKTTHQLLYSRGFATVFGEWQSTPEAEKNWGTFPESLRFPWPAKAVTVVLSKRDAKNVFKQVWSTDIDASSRQVNPADILHAEKIDVIVENGPASEKVDLVILGDGYTKNEMEKFAADAKRLATVLLDHEPFKKRKTDFNIRAVETPAEISGVCKPHPGVFKRSPLSAHYGSFDSERYVLTYDNKKVRDVASAVPYDFMVILVNERTYGGGGIYNLYTTVSADNKFSDYIMVHELGHHIAALADEYYTSAVAYEAPKIDVEPWETNVTALLDKSHLKWQDLVDPGTPIPTPWNKEAFDKYGYEIQKERVKLRTENVPESVMEDLFMRQYDKENEFFSAEIYKDKVGAFEGANYDQKGLYRAQLDCIMYTRHMQYCKVCCRSLENVFDQYSR